MDAPAPRLRRALLDWYDREGRDLPWRCTQDPWAILVSEVMLQQTRVETVLPYYARWMRRFPNPASLAAAPEEEVMRLWAGLGYYSRARNLQRAARSIVSASGGRVPPTFERLSALPGVGDYTAGAVASIAFGVPVAAVDGNVLRVLARLDGHRGDVGDPKVRRRRTVRAAALVPSGRPGDWNQALMDLGATVCLPRNPRCAECPLAKVCVARAKGLQSRLPVRRAKPAPRAETVRLALIERSGRILLVRAAETGLLGGLWGLPGGAGALARRVEEQTGLRVASPRLVGTAEHRFTHRRWRMRVFQCEVQGGRPGSGTRWASPAGLRRAAISRAHRKAIDAAGTARPGRPPAAE